MAAGNPLDATQHPPSKLFVGSMVSVDPKAPVQIPLRLAERNGAIFRLDMMAMPIAFVAEHALSTRSTSSTT